VRRRGASFAAGEKKAAIGLGVDIDIQNVIQVIDEAMTCSRQISTKAWR